jgi:hypothetical protein
LRNIGYIFGRLRPGRVGGGVHRPSCGTQRSSIAQSIFVWLIGFLVWFVVGPGGFRVGPGSPRNSGGWPCWASRRSPEPPGPGPKNTKTHIVCRALLSGPAQAQVCTVYSQQVTLYQLKVDRSPLLEDMCAVSFDKKWLRSSDQKTHIRSS